MSGNYYTHCPAIILYIPRKGSGVGCGPCAGSLTTGAMAQTVLCAFIMGSLEVHIRQQKEREKKKCRLAAPPSTSFGRNISYLPEYNHLQGLSETLLMPALENYSPLVRGCLFALLHRDYPMSRDLLEDLCRMWPPALFFLRRSLLQPIAYVQSTPAQYNWCHPYLS